MNFIKLTENYIKKMKWYDVTLIKFNVFFWTLFLISFWDDFRFFVLSFQWYWYLLITIILMIPSLKKMFTK